MATVAEQVKDAISEAMGDIVNTTTEEIKRSLDEKVDEVVQKRIKLEEVPTFKRKYNEDQFKHSKDMERIMDKIKKSLEHNSTEKASELVDEGKKVLQKRQKLIKVADREDHGWEVVRCYHTSI